MKPDQNQITDEILVAYLLGEATEAQRALVDQSLLVSEHTRTRMAQFQSILELTKTAGSAAPPVDPEAAWQRFRQRVERPRRSFGWMRIAAMLLVALAIGLTVRQVLQKNAVTAIAVAATNQPLTDTLPDGSLVTLNRGAKLYYASRFEGANRPVRLEGEAFFSVAPDKSKPFIITVNDVTVTVVGTSFNIRSDKGQTEVVVETGVVKVRRGAEELTLLPQQRVRSTAGQPLQRDSADRLHAYYRTGEFVCDNTPLSRLVSVLNEAYGSNIVIDRPGLEALPLTATFRNESLEKVLEVIGVTFNLKVVREGDTIHLR